MSEGGASTALTNTSIGDEEDDSAMARSEAQQRKVTYFYRLLYCYYSHILHYEFCS